ncbi:MAG: transposase, partial [Anaerolineaceae bacterium]|nr:transposase [Anaerolineaceae bacterium]
MNIKRYYQEGQIVFITQIVKDRQPTFNDPNLVSLLLQCWHRTKERHPFKMLAYVILPDHFHFLIQPLGDSNFSQILHSLKLSFTNSVKRQMNAKVPFKFWQKRFWDHVIRNEA